MALARGPDRPDPAKSQNAALGELRGSMLWGMGLFFALVMAVVAIAVTVGGMNDGSLPLRVGGQGYLLANPATEPQSDVIDIERLLDSHRARRSALLGTWGSAAAS